MASGGDSEVEETVSGIITGKTTLLNVVKALGDYLTSEEGELRTKGVEFLSSVLSLCPPEKLTRQSVRILATFYCDKLSDTETVIPALRGLGSLTSLPGCTSGEAVTILRAVFSNVKMKALAASTRFLVFFIIDTLMARQRDALKGMGNEFLSGYINLAEGEKDPRNLLTAFAINRVVLIEFRTDEHVETLFNITFCYFPITFKQPLDDPYGITTEMLKVALLSCLNATPAFGQLAIPFFVEKLTAGYPATKKDTLQAMSSCFPVYGAGLARASARKLWSALKLEIFHPVDSLSEAEALNTVRSLVKAIYSESDGESDVQGFAQEICAECIQILREPEKSQAKSAIKILCAFVSTTSEVSRYTISQTLPHLVKLFLDPDEVNNRTPILMHVSDLITAAREFMLRSPSELDSPFLFFKDEVLGIITVGLKTPSCCQPALDGLKGMVTTKALLTDEELGFIVHNINGILQTDSDEDQDASEAALDMLSTISASTPRHVQDQTIPQLFSSLPNEAPPREDYIGRARYWRVLSALSKICVQPELFETLIIRLTTKLDLLCVPTDSTHKDVDIEPTAAYAHSIMTTLAKTLTTKVNMKNTDVPKYINSLVPHLFNLFIYSALDPGSDCMVATDRRLVGLAAQIITLVVQTLSLKTQGKFATALFSAYLQGDITGIAKGHQKVPLDTKFLPFDSSASIRQKNLVAMFAAGVVAFRRDLPIPVSKPHEFLDMIMAWSLSHTENVMQRDAAWHIVASIVNKRPDDVSSFLSNQLEWHWPQEIERSNQSLERRKHTIRSWAWTSKALLLRGHTSSMLFIDRFFELFGDEEINWYAAKAIGDVCGSDVIMTKSNHAVIKPLYAQKLANAILPLLITGANTATKSQQDTPHLVALTSLLQSIPKATFAHAMPSLMPLLLRAVELPDNDIRVNVINTLIAAVEGGSKELNFISEHASTFVSTMLKNSLPQEISSTRVQITALRCLGILPNLVRYDILHPYKFVVIRELAKVLDDPKRSVRREAVDARTNWFKCNG